MSSRIPVAVLGATGTVGQKFVRLLADHPWFELAAVAASANSAGKRYGDAVRWREPVPLPDAVADLIVQPCTPPLPGTIVFSAIEAEIAREVEQAFAQAGALVVTNTKSHRMDADVPLLIPEINADHLGLIEVQRKKRGWSGAILANPNCSTAGLVLALAPLHRAFSLQKLFVATLQAISGAGYPGVPSLDILGNVIPYIAGEEEKIEIETRKILGQLQGDGIAVSTIGIAAHTTRVPVLDGHFEVVSAGFGKRPTPHEAIEALRAFRGDEVVQSLPSSPALPIEVDERPERPQPRLDLDRGNGMAVTVGRVRPCTLLDLRFALLSHNTVRGAAGAAVQIAELLKARGFA